MSWFSDIFKKNSPVQAPTSSGAASAEPAAPFFNVMPRAKVVVETSDVPPVVEKAAPVAPPPPPRPQAPVAPPVLESRVDRNAPPLMSKEQSVLQPVLVQNRAPSRATQIAGVIVVLVLAFVAIGYTYVTFGKNANIFQGVQNFLRKLPPVAHKQANTSIAAPPEIHPQDVGPNYKTAAEWRVQYFGSADCEACGDDADPDKDGLTNQEESAAGTDPNSADTDTDGLVDGDEMHVFGCLATNAHSAGNPQYSDADDLRGGWDCIATPGVDAKLSLERIADIKNKSAQFGGLHVGTVTALGASVINYQSSTGASPSTEIKLPAGVSSSPEAMLDRDVQRLSTIRKVGAALLKYKSDLKTYPAVDSFADMVAKVKGYVAVATNFADPVNTPPLVYGYEYSPTNNSFSLTYFSETQKQLIRYTEQQATDDINSGDMQARDSQRMADLEKIRSALLIYSAASTNPNQTFSFPPKDQYQAKIAPQYIQVVPKDPQTQKDYEYAIGKDGSSFTLKAVLEKPSPGTTGYVCDQEDCKAF